MSKTTLVESLVVLRDEVLATVEHGDRDPPGAEVFDALLRVLAAGEASTATATVPQRDAAIDQLLRDAIARRLAWGDGEEVVLSDAEAVFDRLTVAVQRAVRDPASQMLVIEVAARVAATVGRVISLVAVSRAVRDRTARLREEMAQRQLREVLDRQKATIARLETDLDSPFR